MKRNKNTSYLYVSKTFNLTSGGVVIWGGTRTSTWMSRESSAPSSATLALQRYTPSSDSAMFLMRTPPCWMICRSSVPRGHKTRSLHQLTVRNNIKYFQKEKIMNHARGIKVKNEVNRRAQQPCVLLQNLLKIRNKFSPQFYTHCLNLYITHIEAWPANTTTANTTTVTCPEGDAFLEPVDVRCRTRGDCALDEGVRPNHWRLVGRRVTEVDAHCQRKMDLEAGSYET